MQAINSAWTSTALHGKRRPRGATSARTCTRSSCVAPTAATRAPKSPVRDLFLGEAELQDGEADDEGQEDHRLRARGAEVEADEAVAVELVHQDLGGLAGTALGHRVDDPERLEEREHHVEHDEVERDRG